MFKFSLSKKIHIYHGSQQVTTILSDRTEKKFRRVHDEDTEKATQEL